MPPEPNKKMDELLKRHAQELREKANADFQLHPVTRRILQDEVARVFPDEKVEPTRKAFVWLWPRLAFVGAFSALFAAVLLQLNSPKNISRESVSSTREAKDISAAPAPPQPAEEPKQFAAASADTAESAKVASRAAPPATPRREIDAVGGTRGFAPENQSAQRLSEPRSEDLSAANEIDALADKAERASILPPAATSSLAQAATGIETHESPQRRRKFVQQNLRAGYRLNRLSPSQPQILESFELVQVGNKIQLIERDGSIYEGEILDSSKDVSSNSDLKNKEGSRFAFRVTGKNLPLNQTISFVGNFDSPSAVLERERSQITGELKKQTVPASGLIRGKISMGGTNEFEIRAIESPK